MRAVPALLVLLAGCIAAEPGRGEEPSLRRKACSDYEGMSFAGGAGSAITISPEDGEYSAYVWTQADGTTSNGLVQCEATTGTTWLFVDGADARSGRIDAGNGRITMAWFGAPLVAR